MAECTLVTCSLVPDLDPDDRILVRALERRGIAAAAADWSDPAIDWGSSSICILRSTWDYHVRYFEFIDWLQRAARVTRIFNDPVLVEWNADKSYLGELQTRGVPIVPTTWIRSGEQRSLEDLCAGLESCDLVLKPAKGLAGHDVTLVRRNRASLAAGQAKLEELTRSQDVLVQPYLHDVQTYGERALVFIDGRYSHAIVKKPFDTVLIVDAKSAPVEVTAQEMEVAKKALDAIPGRTLYARIDLLRDDEAQARVSEVELIEPGLYFSAYEPAADALADAVTRKLKTSTEAVS